jgi:hypothetical protein
MERDSRSSGVAPLSVLALTLLSVGLFAASASATQQHISGISFSGSGGRALPPFSVGRASTLFWTSDGSLFQLFSSGLTGGDANSSAHRGWTYLSRVATGTT